ncbi:hypothetical protein OPV22_005751 [Ensete ventricosum]|uniref:Lipoyl-binding domain-containing protein n=1 Tax=Ensete ventricosum TaxID=4639 RepID=A0AAV8RDJ8_ENSVE|nr:hypothetical protein OPV22_005751 [Ensete ventricosum]
MIFGTEPGDRVEVDEPIAQVTIDVASPEAGIIQKLSTVHCQGRKGDTVTPGIKVAVISKSASVNTHVAPSDEKVGKDTKSPAKEEKIDKQMPKVEAPTKEKPKTPSEPQLPPKERERHIAIAGSYAKTKKKGCNTFEGFTEYVCNADCF